MDTSASENIKPKRKYTKKEKSNVISGQPVVSTSQFFSQEEQKTSPKKRASKKQDAAVPSVQEHIFSKIEEKNDKKKESNTKTPSQEPDQPAKKPLTNSFIPSKTPVYFSQHDPMDLVNKRRYVSFKDYDISDYFSNDGTDKLYEIVYENEPIVGETKPIKGREPVATYNPFSNKYEIGIPMTTTFETTYTTPDGVEHPITIQVEFTATENPRANRPPKERDPNAPPNTKTPEEQLAELEQILKDANDEFYELTGRNMTFQEMRQLFYSADNSETT
jgi:hypothetical protein